jgi:hypothetical protein
MLQNRIVMGTLDRQTKTNVEAAKMKTSHILAVFLLVVMSCQKCKAQTIKKDSLLIGKWTICKIFTFQTNGLSSEISFNVCPPIVFEKNHSGFFQKGEVFNWTVEDDKLIIKQPSSDKTKHGIVGEGTFEIIHPVNKTFQEIDLLDTIKHRKYILGR